MSAAGAAAPGNGTPTVGPDDDLRRVATLFLEHGVESLPCVDAAGRVVGVITREAVAARLAGAPPALDRAGPAARRRRPRSIVPYAVLGRDCAGYRVGAGGERVVERHPALSQGHTLLEAGSIWCWSASPAARRSSPASRSASGCRGRGWRATRKARSRRSTWRPRFRLWGKLALMMTFLGIGALPAIVGLWIATLLPIIRNTYAGIRAVPDHLDRCGAGDGHGSGRDPACGSNCPTRCS